MNTNDQNTNHNSGTNPNPTDTPDVRYSLSDENEPPQPRSGYSVYGSDVRLKDLGFNPLAEDFAPRQEYVAPVVVDQEEKSKKNKKAVLLVIAVIIALIIAYAVGYESGVDEPTPLAKPHSGAILSGREYGGSEITVTADGSHDYAVSLKNYWGTEYVAFYVRAGDTVTVSVPAERLYVYFAGGNNWYGYGEGLMFGKYTDYFKDDEALDFTQYTYEYTLKPVTNGNFSETPIDEDEFFS